MMPDVEIPVLSIVTEFPGASPETVEREVTSESRRPSTDLGGQARDLGLREGLSSVIVEFNLEVKINDVSRGIGQDQRIRRELPEGMKEPVIQKFDSPRCRSCPGGALERAQPPVTSPRWPTESQAAA